MGHLSNDHEDHPNQHENSHMSNAMKLGILFSLFHMKIIASVTKNSHQGRCPCYIHLWFFSFTHTLLYVIIVSRTSFRVNTLFSSLLLVYKKKKMIIFTKHSILDVWHGSEYTSGLLKLFCLGFQRDTWDRLTIHYKLRVFHLFRILTWKLQHSS